MPSAEPSRAEPSYEPLGFRHTRAGPGGAHRHGRVDVGRAQRRDRAVLPRRAPPHRSINGVGPEGRQPMEQPAQPAAVTSAGGNRAHPSTATSGTGLTPPLLGARCAPTATFASKTPTLAKNSYPPFATERTCTHAPALPVHAHARARAQHNVPHAACRRGAPRPPASACRLTLFRQPRAPLTGSNRTSARPLARAVCRSHRRRGAEPVGV